MLVSIITPLHNSESFIFETVISVLSQTYSNWELILVDDCSKDNSFEIAKNFALNDKRIKVYRLNENSGAAIARNKAIELATGRFIAFLDSDDLWLPNKLEIQVQFMLSNDVAFSYAAYEKINEEGVAIGVIGVPQMVGYKDLLKTCSVGCLTAMYDTEKLGKVYMPLIRKRQDLALWLKILKATRYGYGIDCVLAKYRVRGDSISANKLNAAQYTWRLYREIERLNIVLCLYYFSHYAVRGVLRTKFPSVARVLGVLQ